MRPKKHKTMGSNDLFRARLDRLTRSSTSSTSWRSSPARSIGTLSTARSHRSTARRGGPGCRRDLRSGCCCSSRFMGLSYRYFDGLVMKRSWAGEVRNVHYPASAAASSGPARSSATRPYESYSACLG